MCNNNFFNEGKPVNEYKKTHKSTYARAYKWSRLLGFPGLQKAIFALFGIAKAHGKHKDEECSLRRYTRGWKRGRFVG
ncbi:MAG TPA: hypothetical protein DDW33_11560 [Ktedonobacter sp.]|nr:hypothetical protein [Ktedonobacter sp.]HAT44373.1 hypothetical protein [Ktedonobacter sp.]HBE26311.1 hypothetical protein [Ktedonobacter sp.]